MSDRRTAQIYEQVFQTTSDGIIITQADGTIKQINPAAAAMLGMTVDEVRDRLATDVFRQNPAITPLFTRGGDYSANVRLPRQRFGYGITKIMEDGSRIVIIQDITEKRELDSRREALAKTISHDLRNPLSAIGGFAELISKFGDLSPQQEKYITRIRQTATKIHDMAKPLVDLAWIEAGMPLAHRPVQMSDTINNAVKELGAIALSNRVTIVVSVQAPMPLVMGDPERMHIVVYNLLHNAIIYSDEEQPVVIHAWSDEQEVFCSVADQGIGISDDELEQVFDRMYRSRDERVRETPGGGLGLTIAKTIVERHGGDMWAASTLGDGSTFTFVLPTAQKE
ncbi:MAG: ATP-binding protein [Chloroflexota bacterium]